ncbi:MAG TPA: amino acid permease, partial [Chitinophagaceae bacterium]|nr:amino acid permease [Chitinophagaceae bacterium]
EQIVGSNNLLYHLLITVGLFGLIASFHGIILAAGRSSFEFGRVRYAPEFLGKVHPRFQTPSNALMVNMVIGIIALLTGKTSEIITIAVFGALTLYIVSMISLVQLRKKEPQLNRPFKVPMYPFFPVIALVIATISFIAMVIFNFKLAIIYFLIIGLSFLLFKIFKSGSIKE